MDERQKSLYDRSSSALPLLIAVFAAVLSISDLMFAKYSARMDTLASSRDRNYQWYQAKGIKSTQVESQVRFFSAIVKSGIIDDAHAANIKELTADLLKEAERYEKDRKEILLGSHGVGEANWSQDVDGKLGQIIGASEYQAMIESFKSIGSDYTYASMLLRICLALGAVGVMITHYRNKLIFFGLTLTSGVLGSWFFVMGLIAQQAM